jgi:hypothetical protein
MITLWQTDEGVIPFDHRKNISLHHLAINKVPLMEALQAAYNTVLKVKGVARSCLLN